MDSLQLRNLVSFLAILVLPAVTFAATQPVCKCGPPTPESYKWDFSKEATGLLYQMHGDAYQAENAADRLESFYRQPELIDWQTDAGVLNRESYWENDMDRILCRLRTIQRVLPAGQQAEIHALAPPVIELTDSAQAAIQFLRLHESQLVLPQYEGYATDMYNEASRVEAATRNSGQYMAASNTGNQTAAHGNLKTGS